MTSAKHSLRRQMRARRAAVPNRQEQSEILCEALTGLTGTICVYVSVRTEVATRTLLEHLEAVVIPRVTGEQMEVVRLGALVPGAFGIPTCEGPAYTGSIDVILLPGLAFSWLGGRLGYGGGYYDRFCKSHPSARRIGLAFREQIVDEIPMDPHDVPVHAVCTPDGLRATGLSQPDALHR